MVLWCDITWQYDVRGVGDTGAVASLLLLIPPDVRMCNSCAPFLMHRRAARRRAPDTIMTLSGCVTS